MPKPNKEIKQLLINDFGYEPVDLESYTGQLRALKESFNSLQITNPKDPRLQQLANGIKDLKADREVEKSGGKLRRTRKRRSDAKSLEQINAEIDAKDKAIADRKAKKKKDAMNFISPGSAPAALPPAEADGGGDMSKEDGFYIQVPKRLLAYHYHRTRSIHTRFPCSWCCDCIGSEFPSKNNQTCQINTWFWKRCR